MAEFHCPFLMARRTKMSALTREAKKVLAPAALALHTGEAIVADAVAAGITVQQQFFCFMSSCNMSYYVNSGGLLIS
jgi:hypothetical protein